MGPVGLGSVSLHVADLLFEFSDAGSHRVICSHHEPFATVLLSISDSYRFPHRCLLHSVNSLRFLQMAYVT